MFYLKFSYDESLSDSLAMEDSLVALMYDTLVTSKAGRCAECASTNTTGELWSWQHINTKSDKIKI